MNRREFFRNGAGAALGTIIFGINFKAEDDRDYHISIAENKFKWDIITPDVETIAMNGEGEYITIEGIVHDLDTLAWSVGTSLSIDENGNLTDELRFPSDSNRIVIRSHSTQGSIFISPML